MDVALLAIKQGVFGYRTKVVEGWALCVGKAQDLILKGIASA